jgi:4-carboxymuconolactone decarboxylase
MAGAERREKGRKAFKQVMGFDAPEGSGAGPFLDHTVESLFGELWSRPGLSVRDRRLITITIVTCLMQETYMKLHLRAALASGDFTAEELREAMLHIAYYAGWPVGTLGTAVVQEAADAAAQT